ncbi:MAG: prepilin-type N-terminal cleavage/methylation domain-containing protein [Candidatus Saccharibacteria bacterium]
MTLSYFSQRQIGSSRQESAEAGFTIIELMISLSILSLVLLLSTYGIVQIGKLYSKGMNQTNTQNAARSIMNNIASQIQLGGATPFYSMPLTAPTVSTPSSVGAVCIGSKRYNFIVNHKLTKNITDHALWRDVMDSSGSCGPIPTLTGSPPPADALNSHPDNGSELMPINMRLTDLHVSSANGFYTITVSVAYGDDDLIQYTPRTVTPVAAAVTACKNGAGSEFCALATLTQTVAPRMAE